MKSIVFDSNYGQFDYALVGEFPDGLDAATTAMVKQGLANVSYRACGSSVDKEFGVKPVSKGGLGRRGIEFSNENADRLEKVVKAKLAELEKDEKDPLPAGIVFGVTGKHEFGESASAMVRATELVDSLLDGEQEPTLRILLGLHDASAATADRDALIAIAHKAGLGMAQKKAAK